MSLACELKRPTDRCAYNCIVARYYKSTDSFTCISSPSISLPVNRVNDDYCDCPDGSDEPGTSACSHLSPNGVRQPDFIAGHHTPNSTIALPGFYCKNKGHIPAYIPFQNVNDGVCDYEQCCDGSDEWEGVAGGKCEDRCKEIGKEWRKQDEERQRALGVAAKKRKELVIESQRIRREVEDRLKTLKTQVEGSDLKVQNLEKEFAEVERKEKLKVTKASTGGGKLAVLLGLTKDRIGELRDSLEKVRTQREAWKERTLELEETLATFKEERNPNFNDEGVKRAVQAWENYAVREKEPQQDDAYERDLDAMLGSDDENGINWDEYKEEEATSDVDVRKWNTSSTQDNAYAD